MWSAVRYQQMHGELRSSARNKLEFLADCQGFPINCADRPFRCIERSRIRFNAIKEWLPGDICSGELLQAEINLVTVHEFGHVPSLTDLPAAGVMPVNSVMEHTMATSDHLLCNSNNLVTASDTMATQFLYGP